MKAALYKEPVMIDFMKDWWALIFSVGGYIVATIFGIGVVYQKQKENDKTTNKRISKLEVLGSKCNTVVRIPECDRFRAESREARIENASRNMKEFEEIKQMFVDARKDHEENRKTNEEQHNLILNHLLNSLNK